MELDVIDPESRAAAPNAMLLKGITDAEQLRDLIHTSSNLMGQIWDERRL